MSLRTWIVALALLLASSGARAGLVEDMAAFEQVNIPALALTGQPQQPGERVAVAVQRLEQEWPRLRRSFLGNGAALERAVAATDRALPEAARLLAAGRRAEAHDALEGIRAAFMEARRAGGIELYVDRLSEFHEVMEEVAKLAQAGAAPQDILPRLQQASGLWSRAERPRFEGALFGFDDAKYALLRERLQAERDTIEALQQALERGERARIGELAGQMKSRFAQIYLMFGDFGRIGGQ